MDYQKVFSNFYVQQYVGEGVGLCKSVIASGNSTFQ